METLTQLEEKIEAAVEVLAIYRMEIEELRDCKAAYEDEINQLKASNTTLKEDNGKFEHENKSWNERITMLISKLESISETESA
ncbi:MAG: cell division protein ZapB [Endozoicomonadaceae bacterium]|nr:cell division protein ZapB [Endozoicomonadaceae bacterium]